MNYKILFSNIGYARGIDGSLRQHVERFGRHFYCAGPVQEQVLTQIGSLIDQEKPDVCCFVEIDQGSFFSGYYNQIEALIDETYHFYDIADKYGEQSVYGRIPFYQGKSNAFMANSPLPFERLYFSCGAKRLIYALTLPGDITLLFAHFSLRYQTRQKQLEEVRQMISRMKTDVIIMADFNILKGVEELVPFLKATGLRLLNKEDEHTFVFHQQRMVLDLCLCTPALAEKTDLQVVPQPFSDHDALLATIKAEPA